MFYDKKNSEEPSNAFFFFLSKKEVCCVHFSGAEKEGEAVCGSQQFFSSSFAVEKKRDGR